MSTIISKCIQIENLLYTFDVYLDNKMLAIKEYKKDIAQKISKKKRIKISQLECAP